MSAARPAFPLPPPVGGRVDVLIVAAEHSGDEQAARMVAQLRAKQPGAVVAALGGRRLEAAGAQLLCDLTSSSAIGFGVFSKIPFYFRLIAEVVRWVGEHRPKAVCFVDSSGLNLRIAKRLFEEGISVKGGGTTKALYFISPQIWASRAGRRFEMARHLDGLAVIFPFEPACYADTDLPVEFVGHPFVAGNFISPVRYDPAGPILLLPGSRKGAVARIFPTLLAGFSEYSRDHADIEAIVLYPSDDIFSVLRAANPPENVRLQPVGTVVAASAVLTSSGTMSLHCALAGIPGAITYRTDALTYLLGRWLVKIKWLGIANLILGEAMYPEFIQGAATSSALAGELRSCGGDTSRRERTAEQAGRLRAQLSQRAVNTPGDWLARQLAVQGGS